MLTVKLNELSYSFIKDKQSLVVDKRKVDLKLKHTHYSVIEATYNNQTFDIEILEIDEECKKATLRINGKKVELEGQTSLDKMLEKLGMNQKIEQEEKHIQAPMPGKVIEIICQEEQHVKKGDNLIILEAMKMENVLKAPSDGVIEKIYVSNNQSVEKNQILIDLETE
ncbi:acetyl-CoA carboxylase biotin carboxyl carrier protein subunit [Flammeovirga yaeyamensis]|uniref:Acetyl-CoA carboxylase biotin carboxyl carrier protein subunit n=1 Tax=Flammeovirga yaeyamensis TaxID=367791 RepID=A0AAX1N003_9BACT|nr:MULTISPECIES: acetyl-CoA carboxylase biotin carboxyl carrier protein subunit [Flammeovirga]ANQ47746.1 acetyl-CoA carboxylase biotin carboxyl carrier protein subunit [Flammeovirga sp. MY04]MBB3700211.1 biotin carboxyl carrier protein [Flammeovirga yaeyamensis]NMF37159.1 acetyl-CoA carboxylase biotin carboxyl carrier protein subunit [Flammeovirga yaeyamensis]QWG00850.1 acetyl-CoA carboxylase biotin carboxyl carrier protein subunit [Flammeovirga yaeyamensis]